MSRRNKRIKPAPAGLSSSAAPVMSANGASTSPLAFWEGDGGQAYTQRNRVDWEARLPFWRHILEQTNAQSFLEVGVNAGWNLRALRQLNANAVMSGVDVNEAALKEAAEAGFDVERMAGSNVAQFFNAGACELAFTAGCLIHVPPDQLPATMQAIADVSSQFVLAVEYAADVETMVEYRGEADRLWKRNYGQLYQDLGLSLVETGQVGAASGFDDCTWWLLEK